MPNQTEIHNRLVGEIIGDRAIIRQRDGVIVTTFDGQQARNIANQLAEYRSKKFAQGSASHA